MSGSISLRDARTIFWREWLRYRRERAYWAGQLLFPLVLLAFIGFGMNAVVELPSGTSYVAHLACGVIALVVASGAVGAGMGLIQERAEGLLRVLLVAPIHTGSILVGKFAARLWVSLLLVAVLVLVFAALAELRIAHLWAVVLAVASITAGFVGLGVALATRLRSFETFRLLSGLVTVPIYLLSPLFYPLATLPDPTRWAAWANPFTYAVDLLRYGFLDIHEIPVLWSTSLLIAGSLAALAIAGWLFHKNEGH